MPYYTQSRSLPSDQTNAGATAYFNGVPVVVGGVVVPAGSQVTDSFRGNGNDDYEKLSGEDLRRNFRNDYKNRFDKGHRFSTTKKEVVVSSGTITTPQRGTSPSIVYSGLVYPSRLSTTGSDYPAASLVPDSKRQADGRQLINMTIPTAPEVSLAAILGELKEKLPSIPTAGFRNGVNPNSIGGEYLNVEFGWRPLIGDVESAARAVADAGAILRQYSADNGRVVRRRASLGTERSNVESFASRNFTIPRLDATTVTTRFVGSALGTASVLDSVQVSTWFSGAYSYYLAGADSFLDKITAYEQKANRLLGTRITPDTIWQLTPWSWLFDWFGDFGTFVSNLTNLQMNSTVLRYGYVMHRTDAKRLVTMRPLYKPAGSTYPAATGPASITMLGTHVSKQRMKATPYGFGLDVGAFSSRQWAILGALGMTKSDRKLRESG